MRRRRGYVLVMTLGLLVLASTLLVTVGREASRRALAARDAQSRLQHKWGAISCRLAIGSRCGDILAREEVRQNQPMPSLATDVSLGGQRFTLLISDELAKANVNALLEESDRSSVESRIREAISGSGMGNAVRLRPADAPVPGPTTRPMHMWITGPGQIFDRVMPQTLMSGRVSSPAPSLE